MSHYRCLLVRIQKNLGGKRNSYCSIYVFSLECSNLNSFQNNCLSIIVRLCQGGQQGTRDEWPGQPGPTGWQWRHRCEGEQTSSPDCNTQGSS